MRVFSNFISLAVSNVFSLGLNFVYTIIVLQHLSPESYGLYSAVLSFAAIITGISYMGLLEIGTRELTRRPPEQHAKLYGNLMALHLTISSIVCLLSIGFVLINRSFTGEAFPIFLLSLFTLVLTFAPTVPTEALLAARGQLRTVAILQGFYALATTVAGGLILVAGGGLEALYLTLSGVSIVTVLVYLITARRVLKTGFRLNLDLPLSLYLLRQGSPGAVAATFYTFCLRFSTYFIFTYIGSKQSAYLGVSSTLLQAVTSIIWIPYAINILPIMTRIYMASAAELKWIGTRSLTLLIAVAVPIAVGTGLMAGDILSFLSKSQITAAPTLRVFIWILPTAIVASFSYRWLLILSKQHIYLLATVTGACVTVLLCFVLVPSVSPVCIRPSQSLLVSKVCNAIVPGDAAIGAAWAAVVSLLVIDAVCLWNLRSWLKEELRVLDVFRIVIGVAGMVAALQFTLSWNPLLRIAVGALVYLAILTALRIMPIHEMQTLRRLLVQNTGLSSPGH